MQKFPLTIYGGRPIERSKLGISRKMLMAMSGHKTESVLHRYVIPETADVADAVQKITQARARNLAYSHIDHTDIPNRTGNHTRQSTSELT